jgi:hypothetical protein
MARRVIVGRPRAFWIAVCNLVGLCFSAVGVVLLFRYALPVELPLGVHLTAGPGDTRFEAQLEGYLWRAHAGLALVIVGTVLEAVPPFFGALVAARRRRRRGPR